MQAHSQRLVCHVQVVSVVNTKLAVYVADGVSYDEAGADINYTVPAMRIISSFASVQQGQLSDAVKALASRLLNMTQSELDAEIQSLEAVSCWPLLKDTDPPACMI